MKDMCVLSFLPINASMSKGIGDFVILVFKLSISKPDCFIASGVPHIRRVAVTQTSLDHLCALLQTAVPLKSIHT